jgi:sulfite reductase (NADPH) flavoprotein alpha-component
MSSFKLNTIAKYKFLFIISSSKGDGEVPEGGRPFESWLSDQTLLESKRLSGNKFSVFGLGDISFPSFCGGSKRLDCLME